MWYLNIVNYLKIHKFDAASQIDLTGRRPRVGDPYLKASYSILGYNADEMNIITVSLFPTSYYRSCKNTITKL